MTDQNQIIEILQKQNCKLKYKYTVALNTLRDFATNYYPGKDMYDRSKHVLQILSEYDSREEE